jgi:opacity protein-like surface antigen
MKILLLAVLVVAYVQLSDAQMTYGGGAQVGMAAWGSPKYKWEGDPANQEISLFGSGFTFGGHGDMNVNKYFTERFSLDYSMFAADNDAIKQLFVRANPNADPNLIAFDGNDASVFSISLNSIGKLPVGGGFSPYALLGIGVHFANFSDPKVTYGGTPQQNASNSVKLDSKTGFAVNFGLGIEYKLKFMKLFLDIQYTAASGSGFLPITIGATFP